MKVDGPKTYLTRPLDNKNLLFIIHIYLLQKNMIM